MKQDHSSSRNEPPSADQLSLSTRELAASRLPFLLRAWWLREFEDTSCLFWPEAPRVTGALWSKHSDPICDAAGIDNAELP